MTELTCALCGGPRSKKSTSGFCRRNPECNRKAQAVADARCNIGKSSKITPQAIELATEHGLTLAC